MKVYLQNGVQVEMTPDEFNQTLNNHIVVEDTGKIKIHYKKKGYRRGKHCKVCGDTLPKGKHRFCSKKCNWQAMLQRIRKQRREQHEGNPEFKKNCVVCNNEFIARTKRQITCSIACRKEFVRKKYQDRN